MQKLPPTQPDDARGPSLRELCRRAHVAAVDKGFYDGVTLDQNAILARLALIHSEVSEATEEARLWPTRDGSAYERDGKPEGLVVELADAVIRIADLCGFLGLELGAAVEQKLSFNETRPYRHGKDGL